MKILMQSSICGLLCVLSSCSGPQIDEKYTTELVKKELLLPGSVAVRKLKGAGSGSSLFLATDGQKKYVIKFIKGKGKDEIFNSKIASDIGCGPKVYFADMEREILVMEYVSGKITLKDLQSKALGEALCSMLRKIHQGPKFHSFYDGFGRVERGLRKEKSKYATTPMPKVEAIFSSIRSSLTPHVTSASCHNDLTFENVQFFGNECKAIDYGDAGLSDPYFDVATALLTSGSIHTCPYEKDLFAAYLGREPSPTEKAKLYLMKQFVLIKWICDGLGRLSQENMQQYDHAEAFSYLDLYKKLITGNLDIRKPEGSLIVHKSLINQVLENSESQEFKDAVELLNQKNSV